MPGFFGTIQYAWPYYLVIAVAGYFLGSIPFGLILTELAGLGDVRADEPADAFAAYVSMLTEWRRLPYLDPGLPAGVLPADWPGGHAHTLFTAMDSSLEQPAATHARSLLG